MVAGEFDLEIPGRAEYMSVARVFIATVGVERSQLPRDRVDDLTIAVSEACTNALQAYRDAGANEICFYGSTAAENAKLIRAWREHSLIRDGASAQAH